MEENDASCGAWEWQDYKEALIFEANICSCFVCDMCVIDV
jgi:hypothetical protein